MASVFSRVGDLLVGGSNTSSTQLTFLSNALTKINKTSRKGTPLREACMVAIAKCAEAKKAGQENPTWDVSTIDMFLTPFQLAMVGGSEAVLEVSLDWLQKVIAHGCLVGDGPLKFNREGGKEDDDKGPVAQWRLIDEIVFTMYSCFESARKSERVMLQLIKALLPAVTIADYPVHKSVLLKAVKTVFNIYLVSANPVNLGTAKAALQQILSVVIGRLEAFGRTCLLLDEAGPLSSSAAPSGGSAAGPGGGKGSSEDGVLHVVNEITASLDRLDEPPSPEDPPSNSSEDSSSSSSDDEEGLPAEGAVAIGTETRRPGKDELSDDEVGSPPVTYAADEAAKAAAAAAAAGGGGGAAAVGGAGKGGGGGGAGGSNTKPGAQPSTSTGAGAASTVGSHYSATYAVNPAATQEALDYFDVLQVDAFLIFKVMCKQSNKAIPEMTDKATLDTADMRNKILSLELILEMLNQSGPCVKSSPRFITAIRQSLCATSLLHNAVSPIPEVFNLSLSIFQVLIARFSEHLKHEVGIFFTEIFLNFLESDHSLPEQKAKVLQVLRSICRDPQTIVNIFLNYDCDIQGMNIFERIVSVAAKNADGGSLGGPAVAAAAARTAAVREGKVPDFELTSLECLVSIIVSMREWCKSLAAVPKDGLESAAAGSRTAGGASGSSGGGATTTGGGGGGGGDSDGEDEGFHSAEGDMSLMDGGAGGGTGAVNASVLAGLHGEGGPLDSPAEFQRRKERKKELAQGIAKFNDKPHRGITFLVSKGHLVDSPAAIYQFLRNTNGLNDKAIGDYISEQDPTCEAVAKLWAAGVDLKGVGFVESLRRYLGSGFRMPGESQRVDRLMLYFAGHFSACNPTQFSSAETAYVLAYATIMLTTDASSEAVKKKMTVEDFIRMTRGIDDGKDIAADYVKSIYESISKSPITINTGPAPVSSSQDKGKAGWLPGPLNPLNLDLDPLNLMGKDEKRKEASYKEHSEFMVSQSLDRFKRAASSPDTFYVATHVDHAKLMFEVAWQPALSTLTKTLELNDEPYIVECCLEGLRSGCRIGAVFDMSEPRKAYITAVTKFCSLDNTRAMRRKNTEALRVLRAIAELDANFLGEAWYHVLVSMSTLERLQSSGDPMDPDVFAAINAVEIDHLFTSSTKLSNEAVVHFVAQMCKVAEEEVSLSQPRLFIMQKVNEVAYLNMGRIRIVWGRMWQPISEFLSKIGCFSKNQVSELAVNNLFQLAMKFLAKDEMSNFNFQQRFLMPFNNIMRGNKDPKLRDLVLLCLSQIMSTRTNNIKSGWRSIFAVLVEATNEADLPTMESAFGVLTTILGSVFAQTVDFYADCMAVLAAYGRQIFFSAVSTRAIEAMAQAGRDVAEGRAPSLPPNRGKGKGESGSDHPPALPTLEPLPPGADTATLRARVAVVDDEHNHAAYLGYWWPVLHGLASLAHHRSLGVRTKALAVLFSTIDVYGPFFSAALWDTILLSVLIPLFDEAVQEQSSIDDSVVEWLNSSGQTVLNAVVDLFGAHYKALHHNLPILLAFLARCILRGTETLARIGTAAFQLLTTSVGVHFDDATWSVVVDALDTLMRAAAPTVLEVVAVAVALADEREAFKARLDGGGGGGEGGEESTVSDTDDDVEERMSDVISRVVSGGGGGGGGGGAALNASMSSVESGRLTHVSLLVVEGGGVVPPRGSCTPPALTAVVNELASTPSVVSFAERHRALMAAARLAGTSSMTDHLHSQAHTATTDSAVGSSSASPKKDGSQGSEPHGTAAASPASTPTTTGGTAGSPVASSASASASGGSGGGGGGGGGGSTAEKRVDESVVDGEDEGAALIELMGGGVFRCIVQISLINTVKETLTVHLRSLSLRNTQVLVSALQDSYKFARSFNGNSVLRHYLVKSGLLVETPNLLKQETIALSVLLRTFFALDKALNEPTVTRPDIEESAMAVMREVLRNFNVVPLTSTRELVAWSPLIIFASNSLLTRSDEALKRVIAGLYGDLLQTLVSERREVRNVVVQLLGRTGALFGLAAQ